MILWLICVFLQYFLAMTGANLVLSTSPPAARHVVASAFDRNAHGKQLVSVLLLLINWNSADYMLLGRHFWISNFSSFSISNSNYWGLKFCFISRDIHEVTWLFRKWHVQAALHALANIAGETRPKSNRIVDGKAEESLRCLMYDVAAQSTKLAPSVCSFPLLLILPQ